MDRHHAIRIAVGKLRGAARAEAIEYLLQHPEAIRASLGRLLHSKPNHTQLRCRYATVPHTLALEPWAGRRDRG